MTYKGTKTCIDWKSGKFRCMRRTSLNSCFFFSLSQMTKKVIKFFPSEVSLNEIACNRIKLSWFLNTWLDFGRFLTIYTSFGIVFKMYSHFYVKKGLAKATCVSKKGKKVKANLVFLNPWESSITILCFLNYRYLINLLQLQNFESGAMCEMTFRLYWFLQVYLC